MRRKSVSVHFVISMNQLVLEVNFSSHLTFILSIQNVNCLLCLQNLLLLEKQPETRYKIWNAVYSLSYPSLCWKTFLHGFLAFLHCLNTLSKSIYGQFLCMETFQDSKVRFFGGFFFFSSQGNKHRNPFPFSPKDIYLYSRLNWIFLSLFFSLEGRIGKTSVTLPKIGFLILRIVFLWWIPRKVHITSGSPCIILCELMFREPT